jgi:hypothetical protein
MKSADVSSYPRFYGGTNPKALVGSDEDSLHGVQSNCFSLGMATQARFVAQNSTHPSQVLWRERSCVPPDLYRFRGISSLSRKSTTTLTPARRGSLRVHLETLLIVTITGALTASARVRDLGLGGAFLEIERRLEVGDSLHLKIPNGLEPFESDATVRSVTPEGIGVEFVRTRPEDLKLLRRLLAELLE